jgi:hypothetical protein
MTTCHYSLCTRMLMCLEHFYDQFLCREKVQIM